MFDCIASMFDCIVKISEASTCIMEMILNDLPLARLLIAAGALIVILLLAGIFVFCCKQGEADTRL